MARGQSASTNPFKAALAYYSGHARAVLVTCVLALAALFVIDIFTPNSITVAALYAIPAAAAVILLRPLCASVVWLVAVTLQVVGQVTESVNLATTVLGAAGLTLVCLVIVLARIGSGDWGRKGVQEDRSRVARELHDGVIQSLAAAQMLLDLNADTLPEPARQSVSRASQSIREAIHDMYSYIFELEPNSLAEGGLERSLALLVEEYRAGSPMTVKLNTDREALWALDGAGADVLQIAREALSNAARHAHAHTAWIDIGAREGSIRLEIGDDGVGFDPQTARGLGIRNLRSRVSRIGGSLEITSRRGEGSVVRVSVPQRS